MKYRISPQFEEETYLRIKNYANAQGRSMSDVVRDFAINGMNRELLGDTEKEILSVMIQNEFDQIIKKYMKQLIEMEKRSCEASAITMYFMEEFMKRLILNKNMKIDNNILEFARLKAYEYTREN